MIITEVMIEMIIGGSSIKEEVEINMVGRVIFNQEDIKDNHIIENKEMFIKGISIKEILESNIIEIQEINI